MDIHIVLDHNASAAQHSIVCHRTADDSAPDPASDGSGSGVAEQQPHARLKHASVAVVGLHRLTLHGHGVLQMGQFGEVAGLAKWPLESY
jgi:hypothetical protein